MLTSADNCDLHQKTQNDLKSEMFLLPFKKNTHNAQCIQKSQICKLENLESIH